MNPDRTNAPVSGAKEAYSTSRWNETVAVVKSRLVCRVIRSRFRRDAALAARRRRSTSATHGRSQPTLAVTRYQIFEF
jgi:hypothetical protein